MKSSKRWVLPAVFVVVSALYFDVRGVSAENDVTVATYNIAAGTEGLGLEAIAETIAASEAEVVGLQEVDVHWGSRSDFEDQATRLAELLDMEVFFAPIYTYDADIPGEPDRQFGLAILSDYPFLETFNHSIARLSTQDADPEPTLTPGFPEAGIRVGDANLWFYSTHLDYRGDPTVREMQVTDMQDVMAAHPNTVLTGDLNAMPDAPELAPLFEQFVDVWDVAGVGEGYTFPAGAPDRRIDYVLTSPGMEISEVETIDSQASDHLLVSAQVQLNPASIQTIQTLVTEYEKAGDIDPIATHLLQLHLKTLDYFEERGDEEKVRQHLGGFEQLIAQFQEQGRLTNRALGTIQPEVETIQRTMD
ncbi:endonuclease/exonuclease/phosphatase family protein [Geomicrobium sp. JCM 19039]|uniref:endonuclease/exonuclease/phosphatase family protein n=1 Tax=Geomicrobium sp. JCM 19039 TaxID=1460636 RepID=UPI00045F3810|nr:endonuclease/exonuclease/phosphatase family protein [Geomicrobium sp. JCM 19039]GAK13546.1 probable secreted protein [Geomicrobium sp. JCM 19039]